MTLHEYGESLTKSANSITRIASLVAFRAYQPPKISIAAQLNSTEYYTKKEPFVITMTPEQIAFAAFQRQLTTKTTDMEEFGAGTVLDTVNNALNAMGGIIDTHAAETIDGPKQMANTMNVCACMFEKAQFEVTEAKLSKDDHPDDIPLWKGNGKIQLASISDTCFQAMMGQNKIATTDFTTDHLHQVEQLREYKNMVDEIITNWECQSYQEPFNFTTTRQYQDRMTTDLKQISGDLFEVIKMVGAMPVPENSTAGMVDQSVVMNVAMRLLVETHKCYMSQPLSDQQHQSIKTSICELVALITSPSGGSDLEIYEELKKHFTMLLRTVSGMELTISDMRDGMEIISVKDTTDTHTPRIELRYCVSRAALNKKQQAEVERYLQVVKQITPSLEHKQMVQAVPQRHQLRYARKYAAPIESTESIESIEPIEDTESTESTGDGDTEFVPLAEDIGDVPLAEDIESAEDEDIKTAFHGPPRLDPIAGPVYAPPSENNQLGGIQFSGRSQPTQQPTDAKQSKMAGFYAFARKAAGKKPTEPHA
ncbi:hypothetical protein T484DRAFT_1755450 [Baffinella frigidus]|nr:hypothetical protein T484DRAFT_1755450 [Cryptophyta sp. CCMP2293]